MTISGKSLRQRYVLGNWKMNGRLPELVTLIHQLLNVCRPDEKTRIAVFPPAIFIPKMAELLQGTFIAYGAQNVFSKDAGAYTGELSALMLKDFFCHYVLLGHSERRHLFQEDEKFIAEKFHHVKDRDMIPVLCVGETQDQRDNAETEATLSRQLSSVFDGHSAQALTNIVVAYEPVWAIGTGKTASPEQAQDAHQFIRSFLSQYGRDEAERLPIVYGGSVNAMNAQSLFSMPDIDGGLIGGASLDAQEFGDIVQCINLF